MVTAPQNNHVDQGSSRASNHHHQRDGHDSELQACHDRERVTDRDEDNHRSGGVGQLIFGQGAVEPRRAIQGGLGLRNLRKCSVTV